MHVHNSSTALILRWAFQEASCTRSTDLTELPGSKSDRRSCCSRRSNFKQISSYSRSMLSWDTIWTKEHLWSISMRWCSLLGLWTLVSSATSTRTLQLISAASTSRQLLWLLQSRTSMESYCMDVLIVLWISTSSSSSLINCERSLETEKQWSSWTI